MHARYAPPVLKSHQPRTSHYQQLQTASTDICWIGAAAGYGKTWFAAGYLAWSQRPSIWYRLDALDQDPVRFFEGLRQASASAIQEPDQLPSSHVLSLPALANFARLFFEQLLNQVSSNTVIVFDNLQFIDAQHPILSGLSDALEAVPNGVQVLLLSRDMPPASFARLRMHQLMDIWSSDELAFSDQEILGLATERKIVLTTSQAATIHQLSLGWPAAVTLLLNQVEENNQLPVTATQQAPELLFDYLAEAAFNRAPLPLQQLLLHCAHLPYLNASLANSCLSDANAASLLPQLTQHNYFVTEHNNGQYHFHPMYQSFLVTRARQVLSADTQQSISHRACRELETEGDISGAIQLTIDSELWTLAVDLILRHATHLITRNEFQTLSNNIQQLPEAYLQQTPWLRYWQARCLMMQRPGASRSMFAHLMSDFEQLEDKHGYCLAFCSLVEAYFMAWDEFKSLGAPLGTVLQRYANEYRLPQLDPVLHSYFTDCVVKALMHLRPTDPQLPAWASHLQHLIIDAHQDDEHRVQMAATQLLYQLWQGQYIEAAGTATLIGTTLSQPDKVTIPTTAMWHALSAHYFNFAADFNQSRQASAEVFSLSRRHAVSLWDLAALAAEAYAQLQTGQLKQGLATIQRMSSILTPYQRLYESHFYYLSAYAALLNRQLDQAESHIRLSLNMCRQQATPFPVALCLQGLARIQLAKQQLNEAEASLDEAAATVDGMHSIVIDHHDALLRARICFARQQQAAGLKHLRKAISLAVQHHIVNHDWWQADVMAELCAIAIEHQIEPQYVQQLVQQRYLSLRDPSKAPPSWPWPLRIYTMGRCSLLVNNTPPDNKIRGNAKPMELLMALIALGGRDVSEQRLQESLWPDTEGDEAYNLLTTTLHRLRKYLTDKNFILMQAHQLSLNPRLVWVDAWGLEHYLNHLNDQLLNTSVTDICFQQHAMHLRQEYQGHFLRECETAWALACRERLRTKFMRAVRRLAAAWPTTLSTEPLTELLEHTLNLDPLQEELYRLLIQYFSQQGNYEGVESCYQRCRNQIGRTFRREPLQETTACYLRYVGDQTLATK